MLGVVRGHQKPPQHPAHPPNISRSSPGAVLIFLLQRTQWSPPTENAAFSEEGVPPFGWSTESTWLAPRPSDPGWTTRGTGEANVESVTK